MKFANAFHLLTAATILVATSNGFSTPRPIVLSRSAASAQQQHHHHHHTRLSLSTGTLPTSVSKTTLLQNTHSPEEQQVADDEIARLKSMAQKLRAEAAALEAERAQELANAATIAFEKFDKNKDGEISLQELKSGLEKILKTELSEERARTIMNAFDVSGDGKLQVDEMVTVDQFRNKLEFIVQEEKRLAKEAAIAAKQEEEAAKLVEARINMLNDGAPTTRDRIVSVLPYLFPLMDSLQFGRFLIVENADNPLVTALALLYAAYRSVPFSGFVAFFALNFLSSNPGFNRLIRFNMQQAIFLDIALFFPGLIAAIVGLIASGAGAQFSPAFNELANDAVFGTLLLAVAYTTISSLLGITPDKIPFISQAVEDRMPTVDMFDDEGRFIPRQLREERKKKEDDDKKKD
ncbi:chloroplast import apparatus Tic20-like protein [Nitzschia inconspicua]|uniref:Chloroplast import apparatus Tic20-like protein n=1 Tax=Nitzschia inconspicua TaxID=303405 RepID=A0A9K3KXN2_9STRA|nr:chloroplast import apparatus Tic20-like protein [Nitzschia inconspicua]